jgi:hypothetical protein
MNNRLLIVGVVIAAGCLVVASVMRTSAPRQQASRRADPFAAPAPLRTESSPAFPQQRNAVERPSRPRTVPPPAPTPIESSERRARAAADAPPPAAPNDTTKSKKPKEKSLEREALAYVGTDPLAEAIWIDAINDPTVSAHDRSDLIEDLNEDGFADPKHLTPDDLPLIESRLSLIEQHAPFAMDDVNAAAFAEAYKDLVNMYAKVIGQ